MRCDCVHGVVPVLCLVSGPLRSPCIASQKTTIPGSPFFPSVAFRSDQCCVAIAAYLATAAGAILLRSNSRPVCVVKCVAAPAGPVTFCHGLRAEESLARAPFMALNMVMSGGEFVRIARAHSKRTSWWCLANGSSQCDTRHAANLSGTEVPNGTLPKDLAAANRSLCKSVAVTPVAAELQRACAVGLPVWILATKAPVCSNRWTLCDLLNASKNRLRCVVVVRLLPPVSVPRFRTAVFLGIWCGNSASEIRLAAVLEDATKAVFVVASGRSNSISPAMSCRAAPAMPQSHCRWLGC